jgi:hypothetical protein
MKESNFLKTDRGTATVKMGLWLIFIIILVVVLTTKEYQSDKEQLENNEQATTEVEETATFKSYDEMINSLLSSNYNYIYTIENNDSKIQFSGTKCNNNYYGYKETTDGILKYSIKDNKYYKETINGEEEINNLYEGIDSSFLNLSNLFENLKNFLYNTQDLENIRTITYDKDGYNVVVSTNLDNIESINITNASTIYELKFNNINTDTNCSEEF